MVLPLPKGEGRGEGEGASHYCGLRFSRLTGRIAARPSTKRARVKRLLLINAVVWGPNYPAAAPHRDVVRWYARWFEDLPEIQLSCVSAEGEVLPAVRAGVDGVILSGSPRDAWADDPINVKLCEAITTCRDEGIPFLGVCYGHQLLARALGGLVARHPQGLELGNTEVELTRAGRLSDLFAGFPDRFDVLSSHSDAVLEMPAQCEWLVRGEFTLNQGFHWRHQLFGVQFHPETDPEILRFIWSVRRESWREKVAFDLDRTLDNMSPTTAAGNVLRNFVTRVIP